MDCPPFLHQSILLELCVSHLNISVVIATLATTASSSYKKISRPFGEKRGNLQKQFAGKLFGLRYVANGPCYKTV